MIKKKFLIIGAGWSGATISNLLTNSGHKVKILAFSIKSVKQLIAFRKQE